MAPSDSNNNSNNDKNPHQLDKQMQEHVKQRKAEMMLFDRFKKIATSKLESMTRQSKESGIPYQMGEQEKQVLRDMQGMGIKEGIAATVVAFLVLRKGPIYISRWIHKRRMMAQKQQAQPPPQQQPPGTTPPSGNNGGGYQLSNPNNKVALPTNNSKNNPFQKAKENTGVPPRSRNPVLGFIWFTIDSMLSLMVGASVSMVYTDMDKIRQQLLESPLLPGRSLIADALCEDIVRELQAIQQATSDKDHPAYQRLVKEIHQHPHKNSNNNTNAAASADAAKSPASYYLEGIIAFSENCQRRQFVERRLRQEQGLMDQNEAVEIPDPIPRDGPRLVLVDNGSGEEGGGGEAMVIEGNDDFNEFHEEDIDWASDFVKDFEEARRK